jgi:hypothetical protein
VADNPCFDCCCEAQEPGTKCCPGPCPEPDAICCLPDLCCGRNSDDEIVCCEEGEKCCDDTGEYYCCLEDETCCEGECCPEGIVCCGGVCCAEGECCEGGECVPCDPPPPEECEEDEDCTEGKCCEDGECVPCPCPEDEDCGEGTCCVDGSGRKACNTNIDNPDCKDDKGHYCTNCDVTEGEAEGTETGELFGPYASEAAADTAAAAAFVPPCTPSPTFECDDGWYFELCCKTDDPP